MADRQARVMMIFCPRSTSMAFTKAMDTVPGSQIFMDSHDMCWEVEHSLKKMGMPVDDELPDDVWRKAAEMLVGEDCSGDRVDINKMKYECLPFSLLESLFSQVSAYCLYLFISRKASFISSCYKI